MADGGPSGARGTDSTGESDRTGAGEATAEASVVARLRAFAGRHGGDVVAVVERLGRMGARIVIVAPSGEFGDAIADSVPAAEAACREAGIPVREWDRELTSRITPTPADRLRMAGQLP